MLSVALSGHRVPSDDRNGNQAAIIAKHGKATYTVGERWFESS